jgi:hypothetical protein
VGEKIKKPANDKLSRKNILGEWKSWGCFRLAFKRFRVNSMDNIPEKTRI